MKLSTINVIEVIDFTVNQVFSYNDDPSGNNEAEEMFVKIAKENGMEDGEEEGQTEDCIDTGCYKNDDYQLFLTYSSR